VLLPFIIFPFCGGGEVTQLLVEAADELQAECKGKGNKFLCFLPLCAVHQPHFTFITWDNVPDQCPKATARLLVCVFGLMKMKATTTTTTTTHPLPLFPIPYSLFLIHYPLSNTQLKAESRNGHTIDV